MLIFTCIWWEQTCSTIYTEMIAAMDFWFSIRLVLGNFELWHSIQISNMLPYVTIHLKDTVTAPCAVTVRAVKCTGAAVESHLVVRGETFLATSALYRLASFCVYIFCMAVEVSPSVETLSTNTTQEPTGSISSIFLFISFWLFRLITFHNFQTSFRLYHHFVWQLFFFINVYDLGITISFNTFVHIYDHCVVLFCFCLHVFIDWVCRAVHFLITSVQLCYNFNQESLENNHNLF